MKKLLEAKMLSLMLILYALILLLQHNKTDTYIATFSLISAAIILIADYVINKKNSK